MGLVMTPQILEERWMDFALTIVSVVEALPSSKAGTLGIDTSQISNQQSAISNQIVAGRIVVEARRDA